MNFASTRVSMRALTYVAFSFQIVSRSTSPFPFPSILERIGKKNNKVEIVLYLICQTENDDVVFEMTVKELYELYNDFNDRSPRRSFTRAERKKILRDFAKTCCYEDNICDNKNVDVLCF